MSQNEGYWAKKLSNDTKGSKTNHNQIQYATISYIELQWVTMSQNGLLGDKEQKMLLN